MIVHAARQRTSIRNIPRVIALIAAIFVALALALGALAQAAVARDRGVVPCDAGTECDGGPSARHHFWSRAQVPYPSPGPTPTPSPIPSPIPSPSPTPVPIPSPSPSPTPPLPPTPSPSPSPPSPPLLDAGR